MQLKPSRPPQLKHTDAATAVTWTSFAGSVAGGGASAAAGPAPPPSLLVCSDDGTMSQWTVDGQFVGVVAEMPEYGVAAMAPCPTAPETLALACTDGTLRFMTLSRAGSGSKAGASSSSAMGDAPLLAGREDKKVVASSGGLGVGATLCVRWAPDGTALATGGEDGCLKIWSRAGMLRTTLVTAPAPIYCLAWSADASALLYASGRDLHLVASGNAVEGTSAPPAGAASSPPAGGGGAAGGGSMASGLGARGATWRAHDGVIMTVDWCHVTGRIASGGEDCRYRVWDASGQALYVSTPQAHVVTAVAWAPRGDKLVVGSFGVMRLCDGGGVPVSSYLQGEDDDSGSGAAATASASVGSFLSLAWSADGSAVGAASGSGAVATASVVGGVLSRGSITATLKGLAHVAVVDGSPAGAAADVSGGAASGSGGVDAVEEIRISDGSGVGGVGDGSDRERVGAWALSGHGHMLLASASRILIYTAGHWQTPHTVDTPRVPVRLLVTSQRHFAAIDAAGGITIMSYDGRTLSSPKPSSPLRVDSLSSSLIDISHDVLAVADRTDGCRGACRAWCRRVRARAPSLFTFLLRHFTSLACLSRRCCSHPPV